MLDYAKIFADSTAQFRPSGLYAGVGTMEVWKMIFSDMRRRLDADRATEAQLLEFRTAVQRGIDSPGDHHLKPEEKAALRDTLDSAFDNLARPVPTTLAPMAQFLANVKFSSD